MTILTQPRRRLNGLVLEDYNSGWGLGAAFGEAFALNPIILATSAEALRDVELGYRVDPSTGVIMSTASPDDPGQQVMQPDDLNKEYGSIGLSFGKPTKRGVAEILAEKKRAEVARQSTLDRATPGALAGGSRFGVQLLASLADPLNIASAFVPVVGEARYALWAARLGNTGARLGRGVAEGAVGAAMIEPVVYSLARQQQADYTMTDSLMNVAFGTVIGGGLHVAGGAIGDAIARQAERSAARSMQERVASAAHSTREAALRTAVAQAAEGENIDVEPILKTDKAFRQTERPRRQVGNELTDALNRLREGGTPLTEPESLMAFLKRYGGVKNDKANADELKALGITTKTHPGLFSKRGADLDTIGQALADEGFLRADPNYGRADIREVLDAIDKEVRGEKVYRDGYDADVEAFKAQEQLREDLARHGIDINKADDTVLEALQRAYDEENGINVGSYGERKLADLDAEDRMEMDAAIEKWRGDYPNDPRWALEDFAASDLADARLADAPETFATVEDAEAALAEAQELFDALSETLGREFNLTAIDNEIADAKAMARGAQAAASCLLRS